MCLHLSRYPILATRSGYTIRDRTNQAFAEQGLDLKIFAELNSLQAIQEILYTNPAWAVLPKRVKRKNLFEFRCKDLPQNLKVHAYMHEDRLQSQAIQKFLSVL